MIESVRRNPGSTLGTVLGVAVAIAGIAVPACSPVKVASPISGREVSGRELAAEWVEKVRTWEDRYRANDATIANLIAENRAIVEEYAESESAASAALESIREREASRSEFIARGIEAVAPVLGPAAPVIANVAPIVLGLVAGGAVYDLRRSRRLGSAGGGPGGGAGGGAGQSDAKR